MHVFEEQRLPRILAVTGELGDTDGQPVPDDDPDLPGVTDGFVLDVLAALANMALRSKRRQADLDAAMRHAGIEAGPAWRAAALERLRVQGLVDKVVELSDGGVLLSVTALGLDRLGGIRSR